MCSRRLALFSSTFSRLFGCLLPCDLLLAYLVCVQVPLPGCDGYRRGRGVWGVWLGWLHVLPSAIVGMCLLL